MTDDEQNTARELIADAFAGMTENLTNVETPLDLAKMVAAGLRDDHDQRRALQKATPNALLMSWELATYGMPNPDDETKHLGGLGIHLLASLPVVEAPLLDLLTNTGNHYAYAIASLAEPDNEPAGVIVVAATRDGWQMAAVAVDDEAKTTDAYLLNDEAGKALDAPADLRATLNKLNAAINRKAAE